MRPQAVGLGCSMVIPENPCLISVPSVAKKNGHASFSYVA